MHTTDTSSSEEESGEADKNDPEESPKPDPTRKDRKLKKRTKKKQSFKDYHREFETLRFRSPFTDEISQTYVPEKLKGPTVPKYDGTGDPDDHVSNFTWAIRTIPMDKNLWCIFFAGTLKGSARYWLESLPQKSISSYKELCEKFTTSFVQKRKFQQEAQSIFGCRQREGETNEAYLKRFTEASILVPTRDDAMIIAAFTYGLQNGPLFRKLQGRDFRTTEEMLEKVNRFLRLEGIAQEKTKAEQKNKRSEANSSRPRNPPHRRDNRRSSYRSNRRSEVMAMGDQKGGRTQYERKYPRDPSKYCDFHKCQGHATRDCEGLKKEKVRREAQIPSKKPETIPPAHEMFMTQTRQEESRGDKRKRTGELRLKGSGRTSQVCFGPDDEMSDGHQGDEPLLIKAAIANILIHRVYVDTGSSTNIMYSQCFHQLPP